MRNIVHYMYSKYTLYKMTKGRINMSGILDKRKNGERGKRKRKIKR